MQQSRWLQLCLVHALTTAGMCAGILALVFATSGAFLLSFVFALLGFMCDTLDGPLARHFSVTTRFGAVYDASVDFVLYLLYPAVAWHLVFGFEGAASTFVLILFVCSGLFRLVRTASRGVLTKGEQIYFIGVPVVLSLPLLGGSAVVTLQIPQLASLYFFVLLPLFSIMMVSQIPFPKPTGWWMLALLAFLAVFIVSLLVL